MLSCAKTRQHHKKCNPEEQTMTHRFDEAVEQLFKLGQQVCGAVLLEHFDASLRIVNAEFDVDASVDVVLAGERLQTSASATSTTNYQPIHYLLLDTLLYIQLSLSLHDHTKIT